MKKRLSLITYSILLFLITTIAQQAYSQTVSILSGTALFTLPGNFVKLTDQELATEFPVLNQRPTFAYENKADTTSFLINYGSSTAQPKDLPQIKAFMEKLLKSVDGNIISSDIKLINNKKYIIIDLDKVNATTSFNMHNYMVITTLNSKLLIMNYTFPIDQKTTKEKQAIKVLYTAVIKN